MVVKIFTPEERRTSLAMAHQIRRERARIREDLRTGLRTAEDLLLASVIELPTVRRRAMRGIRIRSFLMMLDGIGPVTAAKVMEELGINARRKLGGLTAGQRARLLEWLRARTVSEAERSA